MAAHVLTGLLEVMTGNVPIGQIMAALSLSSWTEDLNLSDWSKFYKLAESGDLTGIVDHAKSIVDLYRMVWRAYGEPRTREEWLRINFEGEDKQYDLKLSDGTIVRWSGRNPANAIMRYIDGWGGPRPFAWKLHRNKRFQPLP